MQSAPEIIQRAASFDWEALLPVLFFLLYGLSQLFGRKKKGKESAEEGDEPENEAMERARQIREEIRRKIEERKQAASRGTSAPSKRAAYDPTLPESQQPTHQRNLEDLTPKPVEVQPARPVVVQRQQSRQVVEASPAPSLVDLLEKQRKRLKESKRMQREARAQATDIESRANARQASGLSRKRTAFSRSGNFRGDLLAGLRHPDSTRQAILYREILGKPLGLR